MRKSAIAVLLLVVLGNVGVWALANRPVSEKCHKIYCQTAQQASIKNV